MESIFWTILVGMIAGWLAGELIKGIGFGIFGDILIGVTGQPGRCGLERNRFITFTTPAYAYLAIARRPIYRCESNRQTN